MEKQFEILNYYFYCDKPVSGMAKHGDKFYWYRVIENSILSNPKDMNIMQFNEQLPKLDSSHKYNFENMNFEKNETCEDGDCESENCKNDEDEGCKEENVEEEVPQEVSQEVSQELNCKEDCKFCKDEDYEGQQCDESCKFCKDEDYEEQQCDDDCKFCKEEAVEQELCEDETCKDESIKEEEPHKTNEPEPLPNEEFKKESPFNSEDDDSDSDSFRILSDDEDEEYEDVIYDYSIFEISPEKLEICQEIFKEIEKLKYDRSGVKKYDHTTNLDSLFEGDFFTIRSDQFSNYYQPRCI